MCVANNLNWRVVQTGHEAITDLNTTAMNTATMIFTLEYSTSRFKQIVTLCS